jgi:hypothetical protein
MKDNSTFVWTVTTKNAARCFHKNRVQLAVEKVDSFPKTTEMKIHQCRIRETVVPQVSLPNRLKGKNEKRDLLWLEKHGNQAELT